MHPNIARQRSQSYSQPLGANEYNACNDQCNPGKDQETPHT